jgi:ADP-ribosyl-[dinitrogen reductase] hydrolase
MARFNDEKQNTRRLTLVELLDKKQPYDEMKHLKDPDLKISDNEKIRRIQGSLVGLAVGDALGASVEFRPYAYLKQHKVTDMQGGGTWGLQAGQWTDDTSMALCLAASLIVKGKSDPYDQFERYRQWYRDGYMSSTGKCFDIGKSTRQAITEFESRKQKIRSQLISENKNPEDSDFNETIEKRIREDKSGLRYGTSDSAGNGPLMRLAPIPCFFQSYDDVKQYIDEATQLTHGDQRAIDACKFYAGLIWHAVDGRSKEELLHRDFYRETLNLKLHSDIREIAEGSYKNKKNGYEDGIRGKGYVVNALEAALWAFENDDDQFDVGVLKAINLGDDTDTTAAIYGELAGAVYSIDKILPHWTDQLYQGEFIKIVAKGLYVKGHFLKNRQSDWSDQSGQKSRHRSSTNPERDDEKTSKAYPSHSDQNSRTNSASSQPQHTNTASPAKQDEQLSANSATKSMKPPHIMNEN